MLLSTPNKLRRGTYSVAVIIGTGTAALEQSVDDSAFIEIPDASWSASTVVEISIPNCVLKPVLTGDAAIYVNFVNG